MSCGFVYLAGVATPRTTAFDVMTAVFNGSLFLDLGRQDMNYMNRFLFLPSTEINYTQQSSIVPFPSSEGYSLFTYNHYCFCISLICTSHAVNFLHMQITEIVLNVIYSLN